MSSPTVPGGNWLETLSDSLRGAFRDGDQADTVTVIEVRGADPAQRVEVVRHLEEEHERPVFRLAASDLVAPAHQRAVACLRVLDAAEVAGAIPMLDAVDALVVDRAAAVALEDRLRAFPGVVVVATDGPSRLASVIDQSIHPD